MEVAASVAGSVISSKIAGKGAKAQAAGADKASEVQQYMYDTTREDLAPYRKTGELANNRLAQLMGLSTTPIDGKYNIDLANSEKVYIDDKSRTPEELEALKKFATSAGDVQTANGLRREYAFPIDRVVDFRKGSDTDRKLIDWAMNGGAPAGASADGSNIPGYGSLTKRFGLEDYVADPGYQFRLDQGNKAINAAQAARGNIFSGRALKEATDYNSGMASQEFGNAYNRYNTDQSNLYSRLAGLSDAGRGATNTAVQANQNNANAMGSIYAAQGQNKANSAIQQGNIFSQGLANIFGGGQSSYGSASKLPWQTFGNVNPAGGFYGF